MLHFAIYCVLHFSLLSDYFQGTCFYDAPNESYLQNVVKRLCESEVCVKIIVVLYIMKHFLCNYIIFFCNIQLSSQKLPFTLLSNIAIDDMLYDEQDLLNSMSKIEPINYHQELEHSGILFWCYNAGHVLGAAMFMVEIAGVRILYTGDFSRQEDRHLMAAEIPHGIHIINIHTASFSSHLDRGIDIWCADS